jgi:hypothetical protein
MKSHPMKKQLTFGDFVAGVCQAWGKSAANGIIKLPVKTHIIEFRGRQRFAIS